MSQAQKRQLERDNLYRCVTGEHGLELRDAGGEDDSPVMVGHFVVFNRWTEINSLFEGNFLERFAPGSLKKTMKENRAGMRVLFQHGFDASVGKKPLGPIQELREDDIGGYYEVPLLNAGYVRDEVLPGLRENLYGVSHQFRVIREEIVEDPGVSEWNPKGLPERTIKEAFIREFGPVTFPAYPDATAGIRSLTDEMLVARFDDRDPAQFAELIHNFAPRAAEEVPEEEAPSSGDEEERTTETEEVAPPEVSAGTESHPDDGRRAETGPLFGSKSTTPPWRL